MPVLLIVGLAALLLGIIFFFVWIGYFVMLVKALAPLAFIIGGAVAAYLGWEEMMDKKDAGLDFSNPDEANRYKAEATAYQAEINDMRAGGTQPQAETAAEQDEAQAEPAPEAQAQADSPASEPEAQPASGSPQAQNTAAETVAEEEKSAEGEKKD